MPPEQRVCQNCHNNFTIDSDDFGFYKKMEVPPPTLCPDCRYQRRLMNRNEWIFYRRACDLCKKDVVTIHRPEYPGKVFCQPCWWSDNWDSAGTGQDFDFNRSFFEQFNELRLKSPRMAMNNSRSVNSEYTNQSQSNKNCYLCVSSGENENCLYGYWNEHSVDCVDSYAVQKCELLYEGVNCASCNRGAYLENCADCSSSYFLKDCRGCTNCFGSFGLRGKSNYWFNEQLSPEEHKKRLSEFIFTRENAKVVREKLRILELTKPHKYYTGRNNVGSTGDYLEETKFAKDSFNCRQVENIKYSQDAWFSKESYDITEIYGEFCYENEGCLTNRCIVVAKAESTNDSWYSDQCHGCENLFGCASIHNKKYCIFNKQYTKEEYFELKTKIIEHMKKTGEWGEFFPHTISPYAYNETVAQDYFPLAKEQALAKGYQWYERKEREYKVDLRPDELPKTITGVDDSILQKNILCSTQLSEEDKKKYYNCATAFKITKAEMDFYRKMGLPLPEKCFHDRRQDRMALRNPRKLYERQCSKCMASLQTTYAPAQPKIIYCEACYNAEVV
jgi:hypothetical protein